MPPPRTPNEEGANDRPLSSSRSPAATDTEPVCEPNLSPLAPEKQKSLYCQQAEVQESAVKRETPNLGPSKESQKT